MNTDLSARNEQIDWLRFIGLAMIIFAHVDPPAVLFQIRNFDVPLMVVVAGLSFRYSFREMPYRQYVLRRIMRLVLPVWIFLSLSLCLVFLLGSSSAVPSMKNVLLSYSLLGGVGYVWIIRVFLMVALVAPFVFAYSKREPSNWRYLSVVAMVYLIYECIFLFYAPHKRFEDDPFLEWVWNSTILYLVPYVVVFAIGLRIPDLTEKQVLILMAILGALFAGWVFFYWYTSGTFVYTQGSKYPARTYYLSYALLVTLLLWRVAESVTDFIRGHKRTMAVMLFVAQNSIWIYLWHVPFIDNVRLPYPAKYLVVFSAAVLATWIQGTLVTRYLLPRIRTQRTRNDVRRVLTG